MAGNVLQARDTQKYYHLFLCISRNMESILWKKCYSKCGSGMKSWVIQCNSINQIDFLVSFCHSPFNQYSSLSQFKYMHTKPTNQTKKHQKSPQNNKQTKKAHTNLPLSKPSATNWRNQLWCVCSMYLLLKELYCFKKSIHALRRNLLISSTVNKAMSTF